MQERGSLLWGVSQNAIGIPSHLERTSEERGILEKEPPHFGGSGSAEEEREKGRRSYRFWEPWGVLHPSMAF